VGHGVAGGVAHLPFGRVFLDALRLEGYAGCYGVPADAGAQQEGCGGYAGCEEVACVLQVGAYAKLLLGGDVVKPVLALYVVGLLFLGGVGGAEPLQGGLGVKLVGDAEGCDGEPLEIIKTDDNQFVVEKGFAKVKKALAEGRNLVAVDKINC